MPQSLTPRQRELFNSLLNDFLKEGFAGFTIDKAAQRYHCSKSTIYALGKTRDEIVHRVLVSFFKEIARRTELAHHPKSSHEQRLAAYFTTISNTLSPASPAFMRDLASEPVAQKIYALNTKMATEKIHQLIDDGVAAGEFTADNIAFLPQLIHRTMLDIQQGHYSELLNPAEAYEKFGQLVLHGITAR